MSKRKKISMRNASGGERLERIQRLLDQGPLSLDEATAVFLESQDVSLSDRQIARIGEGVEEKRWLAENVWSSGDDPLTLWMNQIEDCGIELAALELAEDTANIGWSVVVKTPGSDEVSEDSSLGNWVARAQDVASSLLAPPQAIIAPGW